MLQNLTYLELSDNNISGISSRSFLTLKKLQTLKLNGNRLESGNSLHAIGQCVNLKWGFIYSIFTPSIRNNVQIGIDSFSENWIYRRIYFVDH